MKKPHKHAVFIKAWADGYVIHQREANVMLTSMPPKKPSWSVFDGVWRDDYEYSLYLKTGPVYPETRMTDTELTEALGVCFLPPDYCRSLANAAVKRAIQDGDVVLPEGKA